MASPTPPGPKGRLIQRLRHRLAFNLGVTQSRKIAIYEDLLNSVSLFDVNYWLQVLFSAGIATLGLVLNSPAVIIGAMLISPLMGPILANGMAFAVGDLILAARAILCLNLSCIVAVLFAMVLIAILPFKEQTPEIAARIEPNLLDLVVALFSGALGAVATAKEPKGVVTSIPGVAIAVALMPPLCVVGFGLGRAMSLRAFDGLPIALGGGLLFVTNLTAITLMAMLIFLIIRVDVPSIKRRAEEWHSNDAESRWMKQFFDGLPGVNRIEVVGSLRNRFIVVLIPLLALMIPLGQSFGQLQSEFSSKQRQTEIRSIVEKIWLDDFASDQENRPRAYIDTLDFNEMKGQLAVQMRVFTSQTFTPDEESKFAQRLADRLKRDRDTIDLRLVQIETSQGALKGPIAQITDQAQQETLKTVPELQAELWNQLDASLSSLSLPSNHKLLNYGVTLNGNQSLAVVLGYLGDRPLTDDAQDVLQGEVQRRLGQSGAQVTFEFVAQTIGQILFDQQAINLAPESRQKLDQVATLMKKYPSLQLNLQSQVLASERQDVIETEDNSVEFPLVDLRIKAIKNYLTTFEIEAQRIQSKDQIQVITSGQSAVSLTFTRPVETPAAGGGQLDTIPNLPGSPFIPEMNDLPLEFNPRLESEGDS